MADAGPGSRVSWAGASGGARHGDATCPALARRTARPALGLLLALALARLLLHLLTNGQYGFHRDELAVLDDAHHLAWGYVAYPPLTPFLAHVSMQLFGDSLTAFRASSPQWRRRWRCCWPG